MKSERDEIKFKKKRQFLLILPLLIVPFLTLGLYAMGDDRPDSIQNKKGKGNELQTKLPDARIDGKQMDKMSYYNAATADSIKKAEMIKGDPYYQSAVSPSAYPATGNTLLGPAVSYNGNNINAAVPGYSNTNEARVYQRLNALNDVINQPVSAPSGSFLQQPPYSSSGISSSDIDRLENMMKVMQSGSAEGDPEMQQASALLEKILDLQHPERVQQKLKDANSLSRGKVYAVSSMGNEDPISIMKTPVGFPKSQSGFFSLDESPVDESFNTIPAVIAESRTLVTGSIVKLRLGSDINVNGVLVPSGTSVFGKANISEERLNLKITSIKYKDFVFPVELDVFDQDGLTGISIPGAISRDVAKESGANAIQGLGFSGIETGLGAQAASAGIELSKNLFSKKIKLVKVNVKTGYQILLKDQRMDEK